MWFRAANADKRESKADGGKRRSWANKATMGRVARHEIPKAGTSEQVDRGKPRDGLGKMRPKRAQIEALRKEMVDLSKDGDPGEGNAKTRERCHKEG